MARNKKDAIPHYEMLYIVPNKFTEDDVKGIKETIAKLIEDNKGKITFSEDWGKKRFCYPIKHAMHGYYLLVEFDMEAKNLAKVNTELRMNNEVLRHMIVNTINKTDEQRQIERDRFEASKLADKEEKASSRKPKAKQSDSSTSAVAKKEAPKKEEAKKVDAKELDDKLNKILDTDDLL